MRRLILGALLALGMATAVPAQQMQIRFAEPVSLIATPGTTQFDAYGRRFALELESNDRLLKALPGAQKSQLQQLQPLRGVLEGVAGSWVRLARLEGSLEGAIWDGRELYVVTSASRISRYLVNPLDVPPTQTVVYRLSDTLNALPAEFCGLKGEAGVLAASPAAPVTALKQFESMVEELRAAAKITPTDQLDLSLIADSEFQAMKGAGTAAAMVARLNIVDGIFAGQVGVLLVPSELRLAPAGNPLTSTNSSTLLGQLGDFRNSTQAVRDAGLAHLVSGKNLDGTTIGIAYLDSLCDPHDGVSLSTSDDVDIANAVVMAHEIGHNFGAEHDGEAGSVCAATEPNFVMAPAFNGSIFLSQCSKTTMAPKIALARGVCIGSPDYADVTFNVPVSTTADVQTTFSVPFTVTSQGNRTATNVTLDVMLGTDLSFQSAVVVNGSCAVQGGNLHCTLGDIPAGEDRLVDIRLRGTRITQYNLVASVAADNDYLVDDNEKQYQLNLRSAVDLAVAASLSSGSVFVGDAFQVTVDVSSIRSLPAHGGTLQVNLFGLPVDAVAGGSNACTVFDSVITCQLADLAPGATTRVVVTSHGTTPRGTTLQISTQLTGDGDPANNLVNLNLAVLADREVITTASAADLGVAVGQSQDITFTVTAAGRFPIASVEFSLQNLAFDYFSVQSIVPSAGTCAPSNNFNTLCQFGTLSPGDVRTVVVRVRADRVGNTTLSGRGQFTFNGVLSFSGANVALRSNVAVDVYADGSAPPTITEGESNTGQVLVQSLGTQLAQNVVATLEVPAPMRLTAVSVLSNSALTCAVETAQRIRCTGAFTNMGNLFIRYQYTSDVAGDYPAAFHITADGDADDNNDDAAFTIRVLPYLDVALSTTTTRLDFIVGQLSTFPMTVTTGNRAVPGVRVVASSGLPYYEVESMSAPGFTCQAESFGASCNLGELPAGANVPVSVRYRPLQENASSQVNVDVQATRDSNGGNNAVHASFDIMAMTDIRLQLAQTSVSATNGTRFQFPRITVTSATALARNVVVTVPIPAFATVDSVSTTALCSGTTTLRCDFGVVAVGSTATLDIALQPSATGSFTSDVSLVAANDSTGGNNAGSVAVSVTAASSSSSGGGGSSSGGSPGGGGGGGRLEWMALAFLALLAARRIRSAC